MESPPVSKSLSESSVGRNSNALQQQNYSKSNININNGLQFHTRGETGDGDGLSQLIANLDHDISSIRTRALAGLQQKLEHGLVQPNVLCKRVDLMHRLTCWLRTPKLTDDELHLIITFLSHLCRLEGSNKSFLSSQLEGLLAVSRLVVRKDTRLLINELLDSVQTFDMHFEGSPAWNDNNSTPLPSTSRSILRSSPAKSISGSPYSKSKEIEFDMQKGQGEQNNASTSTPRETYFDKQHSKTLNKKSVWTNTIEFGIPSTQLHVTDRRVLASTTESVLSKDEHLVFITTCFIRDVLLQDFPPELFIQESSITLSLLQVVEDAWVNERVNYSAMQALLKLSGLLRNRINFFDSSDYYHHASLFEGYPAHHKSSLGYHSSRQSDRNFTSRESSKDYFVGNLAQFIKGILRGLNFKPKRTNLWILLNSYCTTFEKCLHLFGCQSGTFPIYLQEVLLELSQFFLKYSRSINATVVAVILASLLSCFEDTENIVLSKDIRHAIWNLVSQTNLQEISPATFKYFMDQARPFQLGLDNILPKSGDNIDSEFTRDNIYNDWWQYDKTESSRIKSNSDFSDLRAPQNDPQTNILNILHSIQNATQHQHVQNGIECLWESSFVLLLNDRMEINVDAEIISESNLLYWREAFDKFLSVEPACLEDEELLARVLDLLSFLNSYLHSSEVVRSWIQPLVIEKGSATRNVFMQSCLHKDDSLSEGTALSMILRSSFDFYYVMLFGTGNETISPELCWEFLQFMAQSLEKIANDGYSSTASLHSILFGITHLTSEKSVIQILLQHEGFIITIIGLLVEAVYLSLERAGSDSFRNHASIHYGTKALLQMVLVQVKEGNRADLEWTLPIVKILPLLWSSQDCVVRTAGFQISDVLTKTSQGTSYLLSQLVSPAHLWTNSYLHLMSSEEIPIVRRAAGSVLINLIDFWEEMKKLIDHELQVPKWKLLEDLTSLLGNMYWHSTVINQTQGILDRSELDTRRSEDVKPIITPKVLSTIAKLIIKALPVHEEDKTTMLNEQPTESILQELCDTLFRMVGHHEVNIGMSGRWWVESITSLSNVVQVLTQIIKLRPNLTSIIFMDKFSLSALIKLLSLKSSEGVPESQAKQTLTKLWLHTLILLTTLSNISGQHFEDLERTILIHKDIIFPVLVQWLDVTTDSKARGVAIEFLIKFLSICIAKEEGKGRSFLNNLWEETFSQYASHFCEKLTVLVKVLNRVEELIQVLMCYDIVLRFFKSASEHAVKQNLVDSLIKLIRTFGMKSIEVNSQYEKKDTKGLEQIKWTLLLLSTMFQQNTESRKQAMSRNFADALHTTKITCHNYVNNSDRVLLHTLIESLVNFTNEFPEGCHSLTLTTGLVGVPSRKTATPNSLFVEILNILQNELDLIESNPTLKTIDLIMSFINNIIFSVECRNILVKTNIPNFVRKLQFNNVKKWNIKQQHIKLTFMQFLVHMTKHPDIQLFIAKIDDAVDIIVQLAESDTHPSSLMALETLRNLSFHAGNRARLLTDPEFLPYLSRCLSSSDSVCEIMCSAVSIWALISNCERGKVAAKNANCGHSLVIATKKLRKKQPTNPQESDTVMHLFGLLESISNILNGGPETGDI